VAACQAGHVKNFLLASNGFFAQNPAIVRLAVNPFNDPTI
jgi:hypothetical protein